MIRTIFVVFIACAFTLMAGACGVQSTAAGDVTKILSAISQAKSYTLDTDITDICKFASNIGENEDVIEWKGTRHVNSSSQQMAMNMTIADNSNYINADIYTSFEMYIKDKQQFLKTIDTPAFSTNPLENTWTKTSLDNILWKHATQNPYIMEFLQTANQVVLLENEKVNGIECFVLAITPSPQASVDFIIAQQQTVGPQIQTAWGGATIIVRKDAYQNGSVKLWVDQTSYLPIKVEFNIDFKGNVGGGAITSTPYTPTTNPVDSSFHGQFIFSNYNQPVSIQIPPEALNIK